MSILDDGTHTSHARRLITGIVGQGKFRAKKSHTPLRVWLNILTTRLCKHPKMLLYLVQTYQGLQLYRL